MAHSDIRECFLAFFEKHGHTRVKSSSLVPHNDPTLLFTNAGMVQFKDVFIGKEKRPYTRATSSQKCVRAGGKHNDLENVGHTARHHTFFEMLGNFSFGDYFKADACSWGWEFVTRDLGISPKRLYFTVFREDDEAEALWKKIGAPADRIFRMDEKDNFWAMGDTGPCGPCSEIIVDQGEGVGCQKPGCSVYCNCDRHLEIWNLVFMQFERDASGATKPLPKPSIDTGMGLERVAAILEGVSSNYESYLFRPILQAMVQISHRPYNKNPKTDISMRVIADHIRAMAFLIADGVLPSNEGRGYVLRRIMRRAIRHGKLLDLHEPFLFRLFPTLKTAMGEAYPELKTNEAFITSVIKNEEEAFHATLENGLGLFEEAIRQLGTSKVLGGDIAFKLYDTYGFPLDLTQLLAQERGLSVDTNGFERRMDQQRNLSRKSWKGSGDEAVADIYKSLRSQGMQTLFLGYDQLSSDAKVIGIIKDGKTADSLTSGETGELLFDQTPFYGEQGGQVGDTGTVTTDTFAGDVTDTQKPIKEIVTHTTKAVSGTLRVGDRVCLHVDAVRRQKIRIHHSLTHVLQATLNEILGSHIKQSGSLVTPDYLRFDFTHFSAIDAATLRKIEERVNERIRENHPVSTCIANLEDAIKSGAKAFFGEKYEDAVRVVSIGTLSKELCGGTHARSTGEAGLFKIISEQSVASGVRRITALAGEAALRHIYDEEDRLRAVAQMLGCGPKEIEQKIRRILEREKELEKMQRTSHEQQVGKGLEQILQKKETVGAIDFIAYEIPPGTPEALSIKELRLLSDKLTEKNASGIVTLLSPASATATLASGHCPITAETLFNDLKNDFPDIAGGGNRPAFRQFRFKPEQKDEIPQALKQHLKRRQQTP